MSFHLWVQRSGFFIRNLMFETSCCWLLPSSSENDPWLHQHEKPALKNLWRFRWVQQEAAWRVKRCNASTPQRSRRCRPSWRFYRCPTFCQGDRFRSRNMNRRKLGELELTFVEAAWCLVFTSLYYHLIWHPDNDRLAAHNGNTPADLENTEMPFRSQAAGPCLLCIYGQ